MKKPNTVDSYEITDNIREGDPLLAEILKDCYETISSREKDGDLTIFENGLKGIIELATIDKEQVLVRESEGVLKAFNRLLDKKTENNLIQTEQDIFEKIQGLFYIKIFSEEGDISRKIGDFAESIMRLDYSQKLPTFSVKGVSKNLFNYFGFALESIAESMSSATFSKKSVNAYFETLPNIVMIVTDKEYNIRSINSAGEVLFDCDALELEGELLQNLIPEFEANQISTFINNNSIKEHIVIETEKYGSREIEASFLSCDNDDEVPELVFILNFKDIKIDSSAKLYENFGLVGNVIGGVKKLRNASLDEVGIDQTTILLENLYKLKENLGTELLNAQEANNQLEVIDFNVMLKQLSNEIRYLIDIDQVDMTISNKTCRPFCSNYSILFSIIKNLLINAIHFHDPNKSHASVVVEIEDRDDSISIQVKDNGIGIDNTFFNTIFEKGYTTAQNDNNLGMGLYFVKKNIICLGGDIQVVSEPSKGSTFNILLPRKHMPFVF
jgi:hypothetical protein